MTGRKRRAGDVLLFPLGRKPELYNFSKTIQRHTLTLYLTKLKDILHPHYRGEKGRIYLCIRSQRHNHFQLNKDARMANQCFPFDQLESNQCTLARLELSLKIETGLKSRNLAVQRQIPRRDLDTCTKIQVWHTHQDLSLRLGLEEAVK